MSSSVIHDREGTNSENMEILGVRRNDITKARDIRNVITTGRSLVLSTSAAEWSAKATPCLPNQQGSAMLAPEPRSRTYKENKVERVS